MIALGHPLTLIRKIFILIFLGCLVIYSPALARARKRLDLRFIQALQFIDEFDHMNSNDPEQKDTVTINRNFFKEL